MALVDRRGLTRGTLPAVAASRAAAKKQRRHRVVIESVAQEQKKLKTTISFKATPPPGYTFIPAGNPDLTTALKEASRQANRQIIAVTTSTHGHVHDLSKEVHRIGFHFPSDVVAQVCNQYGITLTAAGVVADENAESFRQMRQRGQRGNNNDTKKDQITVNTEARDAIKDLFPKIPDDDLFTIIKGAFQKGQRKVGTANELPLVRRAQLSVVAHVRHVYTRYDRLLREVGYRDARAQVEGPTLRKLVEWRGDDDNTNEGKQVLEDVFREVIVLSDDDDDSDDDTDDVVEVVHRTHAWPLPSHHSITSFQPLSARQYGYQSADDDASGYRVAAKVPRRNLPENSKAAPASAQFRQSRYAAWDRARAEYRADPTAVPAALVPLSQHDPKFYYQEPEFNFNDPLPRPREIPVDTRDHREAFTYTDRQIVHDQRPPQREYIQGADGYVYEKLYEHPPQGSGRHGAPQAQIPPLRRTSFYEAQDSRVQPISSHIMPSIEDNLPPSPENGRSRAPRSNNRMDQTVHYQERHSQSLAQTRNAKIIDLTDNSDPRFAKRSRMEDPPTTRRPVNDFENYRRISDRMGSPEHHARPALEPLRHRPEIVDLSSPKYIREPLYKPRMAPARRTDDIVRMGEGEGSRSYARVAHSMVEAPIHAPGPRYTYEPERSHQQNQGFRSMSPPRVNLGAQNPPSGARSYPSDVEYHPQSPALRSEDYVARRTTAYHEGLVPVVRPTAYDGDRAPYVREYIPVNTSQPQTPVSAANRVPQQSQPVFYVDSSPRGPQHDRYERMPPPTYVRN